MANRITNEQREAIVRKAVAERDAALSATPAKADETTIPAGHEREQSLAVMVRRLLKRIRKVKPDDDLAATAEDYLKRLGMPFSPLRDEKADERGSAEPVKDCNPEQNQKIMTWQPIKTAPRDGTNILIAFGRDGVSQAKYVPGLPDHPWQFLDTNDGITWLVNYAKDGLGGPSHWKSLPQWPDRAMKGGSGFGSAPTAPARDGSEPGLHASHSAQTATTTTTTLCEFNPGCTKRCDVCPETTAALKAPSGAKTVSMADAIAAGDGTLHAAIDYWHARALKAEAVQPPSVQRAEPQRLTDYDIRKIHSHDACLPDLVGLKDQWPEILRFARAVESAIAARASAGRAAE